VGVERYGLEVVEQLDLLGDVLAEPGRSPKRRLAVAGVHR